MSTQLWEPMRPQGSLSSRIAARIDELIAVDQLEPGDRLPPERELASLLGVSRPSVREAVRTLAAQGRLSIRHGQGVFIEEPATTSRLRDSLLVREHDVDELYAMREVLEVPAARWAAQNSATGDVTRLDAAYELLTAAVSSGAAWEELQRLDAAFHESVVRVAGNKFLMRTLGVLNEIMAAGMETTLSIPGRLQKSEKDHQEIFTAIKAGDPRRAERAARTHIRAVHRAAKKRVETISQDGGQAGE